MLRSQLSELKSSRLDVKDAFYGPLTVVCAWCSKKCINVNRWEHIYVSPGSTVSHGICPECTANLIGGVREVDCAWCGKKYVNNNNNLKNDYVCSDVAFNHGICQECITDIIGGISEIKDCERIAI